MRALTKLILVVVLGFGVGLGLVLYLVEPSLQQVVRLNGELKNKKIETKTLEQQILAFKTAQSDLSKATEKERILGAIVTREDLVGPVQNLESATTITGTDHNLTIEDFVLKRAQSKDEALGTKPMTKPIPGVQEVPFEVSTEGDFLGLLDTLRYLENSKHFTEIVNLELVAEKTSAETGSNPTGIIFGNLKGVFYITNTDEAQTTQQ